MPSRHERHLLDGDLIRDLRLEHRLSQRELADRIGISSPSVARMEENRNHSELPLHVVDQLASALGVPISQLLAAPPPGRADAAGDLALLAAALLEAPKRCTRPSTIASALGWTRGRVSRAGESLDEALHPLGMRLRRGRKSWTIEPDHNTLTAAQHQRLRRRDDPTTNLSIPETRTLARAIRGELTKSYLDHRTPGDPNVAVHSLINKKLIEVGPTGDFCITAQTAYALGLINHLPGPNKRRDTRTTGDALEHGTPTR